MALFCVLYVLSKIGVILSLRICFTRTRTYMRVLRVLYSYLLINILIRKSLYIKKPL